MKVYRPVLLGVLNALNDIFIQGYYTDKVIERSFKNNKKWGARDRRLFAEAVYDIVRWQRKLKFSCDGQIQESELIAEDLSLLLQAWLTVHHKDYDSLIFEDKINVNQVQSRWKQKTLLLPVDQSIPDWIHELGESELVEKWDKILEQLNKKAPIYLRCNELKTSPEAFLQQAVKEGLELKSISGPCFKLIKRKNVFQTEAFQQGIFEMQDGGSQQISPFLQAKKGHRVIDACAGAGGKTLHLAALMGNKGKIIAMDIHQRKLEELKKRSRRAGVDIVETRLIENKKMIKRLSASADRLLLDVPCSGLGVIRRNPDTKWKLTPLRFKELQQLQQEILNDYSKMLKPGGKMVYATCSVLPSENQHQVNRFLKNHKNWWLEEEKIIFPDQFDGFYMARLALKE